MMGAHFCVCIFIWLGFFFFFPLNSLCISSPLWIECSEVYFWFCSIWLLSRKHSGIPTHQHRQISTLIPVPQSFPLSLHVFVSYMTHSIIVCWTYHGSVDVLACIWVPNFRMSSAMQYLGKLDKSFHLQQTVMALKTTYMHIVYAVPQSSAHITSPSTAAQK